MEENSPGEPGVVAPLPSQVQKQLRAGVAISCLAQCVEELVYNAIDARASCVAVRVDLSLFKVEVIDNGCGVSQSDLNRIGSRYVTSKCHTLQDVDLGNLPFHGYRGEALASIRQMSSILQITSRASNGVETYVTTFVRGKRKPVEVACQKRNVCGTTVIVNDFFFNMPVRRKTLNLALELEDIRETICGIVLLNPNISLTLRNEISGEKLLQTHKCQLPSQTFLHLFGSQWTSDDLLVLESRVNAAGKITIKGFVANVGHTNKTRQFVFVNQRQVRRSKLAKLINKAFKNSTMVRPIAKKSQTSKKYSPSSKGPKKYPVYCLMIECPQQEVDFTFEPRKTEVVFQHWSEVAIFVETKVQDFLREHSLLVPSAAEAAIMPTREQNPPKQIAERQMYLPNISGIEPLGNNTANQLKKAFSPQELRGARKSLQVSRQQAKVIKAALQIPSAPILKTPTSSPFSQKYVVDEKGVFQRSYTTNSRKRDSSYIMNIPMINEIRLRINPDQKTTPTESSILSRSAIRPSPLMPKENMAATTTSTRVVPFVNTSNDCATSFHASMSSKVSTESPVLPMKRFDFDQEGSPVRLHTEICNADRLFQDGTEAARTFMLKLQETDRLKWSNDQDKSVSEEILPPQKTFFNDWQFPPYERTKKFSPQYDTAAHPMFSCINDDTEYESFTTNDEKEDVDVTLPPVNVHLDCIEKDAVLNETNICDRLQQALKAFDKSNDHGINQPEIKRTAKRNLAFDAARDEKAPDFDLINNTIPIAMELKQSGHNREKEDVDVTLPPVNVHLDCNEKDAVLNETNIRGSLQQALKAFEKSTDHGIYQPEIKRTAKRNLAFDAARDEKAPDFDLINNTIPIAMQHEQSGHNREFYVSGMSAGRKKRPWLLPPGTTPFMKKERVMILAEETTTTTTCTTLCNGNNDLDPTTTSSSGDTATTTAATVFSKWRNPILELPSGSVTTNFEDNMVTGGWRSNPCYSSSLKLDKSLLDNCQVIGQIDVKFIGVICRRHIAKEEDQKMLMLFDQHAVHERVRLEQLLDDNYPENDQVLTSLLQVPLVLDLTPEETRLLRQFGNKCKKFGLVIEVETEDDSGANIVVSQVPRCFLHREATELNYKRTSPLQTLVIELAKEIVQSLHETHGGLNFLPKAIGNVLKSQACRTAIMFGDKLEAKECITLIDQLKNCKAPFQCAHGRPSVAPIVDLTKLSIIEEEWAILGKKLNFDQVINPVNF